MAAIKNSILEIVILRITTMKMAGNQMGLQATTNNEGPVSRSKSVSNIALGYYGNVVPYHNSYHRTFRAELDEHRCYYRSPACLTLEPDMHEMMILGLGEPGLGRCRCRGPNLEIVLWFKTSSE